MAISFSLKKQPSGQKKRTNVRGLLIVLVGLLACAEIVGAGYFIITVLYGKPADVEVAGSGRTSAQVDSARVEAVFASIDRKPGVPTDEELRNVRNPFLAAGVSAPPATPPPGDTVPPTETPGFAP